MRRPAWIALAVIVAILVILIVWNPLIYIFGGFLPLGTLVLLIMIPLVVGIGIGFVLGARRPGARAVASGPTVPRH